jgi:hypothetical protein
MIYIQMGHYVSLFYRYGKESKEGWKTSTRWCGKIFSIFFYYFFHIKLAIKQYSYEEVRNKNEDPKLCFLP